MPIATAPASETAASATSVAVGMRVRSGRPFSSSSACAATPIASANAASAPEQPAGVELRRERGADRDVGQVPGRVRRVEERDVVAPAARAERVERGPGLVLTPAAPDHDPAAEATSAATRTSRSRPRARARAAAARERARSRGCSGQGTSPTSCQPGEISRPASGQADARPRAARAAARAPCGTPNSSPAIVPPGRTTRASSRSVAAGIVDVAEQVGEREAVERAVGEGQLLGARPRRARRRRRRLPARASASISGALVEADDRAALLADELERDRAVPVATSSTRSPGPASTRETRNRRQRGSWPNESSARSGRSVGPSGAKSSRARVCDHGPESKLARWSLEDDLRRIADSAVVYAADGGARRDRPRRAGERVPALRLCLRAGRGVGSTRRGRASTRPAVPVEERGSSCATPSRSRRLCEVAEEAAGIEPEEPAARREPGVPRRARRGRGRGELGRRRQRRLGRRVEELLRDVERGYKRPLS